MKRIALTLIIAAFFLVRPYALQENGMWYAGDDYDYFAQSSWIVFGQYPSYKHEFYTDMKQGPKRSVGPGILATPFVFVFSLLDRWEGAKISSERTYNTIAGSWSQFGFIVSSIVYLCLGCFLLYWACLFVAGPGPASWAVILMIICQGLPLYAFRRPIFSHATEFFLQSLMVYLLLRNADTKGEFLDRWYKYASVGVLAALIFLVRYNNILIALAWPVLLLTQRPSRHGGQLAVRLFYAAIPFVMLVVLFKVWPEIYNNYHPYADAFSFIRVQAGMMSIIKRLAHVFVGLDWGLVFTAPFLLLGVGGLVKNKMVFKRELVLASLPLLINFYVIIFFGTQGGWYGYRYLIASAFPVFVVPLAFMLGTWESSLGRKVLFLLGLLAITPILSMMCFEGNATTLTLHMIPQDFGRTDWSNDAYIVAVWKTALNVHEWAQTFFKGGMYYLLYFLSLAKLLPQRIVDAMGFAVRFPCFEWKILVRTVIIYLIPLGLWQIFKPRSSSSS